MTRGAQEREQTEIEDIVQLGLGFTYTYGTGRICSGSDCVLTFGEQTAPVFELILRTNPFRVNKIMFASLRNGVSEDEYYAKSRSLNHQDIAWMKKKVGTIRKRLTNVSPDLAERLKSTDGEVFWISDESQE